MLKLFYSSVILNSTETDGIVEVDNWRLYSSVILNSTETQPTDRKNGRGVLQ